MAFLCLPGLLCKKSPLFVLLRQLASEDPSQTHLACQGCQAKFSDFYKEGERRGERGAAGESGFLFVAFRRKSRVLE